MYLIPIFAILNRLRGASGFPASIHGLAFSLYMYYISNNIWVAILTQIGYEIGERQRWGEWVGVACGYSNRISQNTNADTPKYKVAYWIHFVSAKIVPKWWTTDELSLRYANVALVLRGAFWFACVLFPATIFGVIDPITFLVSVLFLGESFALSCFLGRITTYKIKFLEGAWSWQEVYYGALQGFVMFIIGYLAWT